ncbi:predicted protein [Naegleria gruberi]|uniref:Predicted protein n=1 Tax=Naegleria gruberi TaxID=5762 RepID=D2W5D9_NAEGR|nr:uncharacterized protein NAEGRDRAFT_76630 [Naegleria gruberi]EFC35714.1 predicted protein [Naegleria gruberi]|eukprot:XP_002668458.1 predicted protein [Naegleria gruberi strain NEG-M]
MNGVQFAVTSTPPVITSNGGQQPSSSNPINNGGSKLVISGAITTSSSNTQIPTINLNHPNININNRRLSNISSDPNMNNGMNESYFEYRNETVMGIQPTYNYGEYGQWIARSLNFPITFGFDYLPYIKCIYNELENSIYFGVNCATIGSAISGIISIYVNIEKDYNIGLGLIGMHIGRNYLNDQDGCTKALLLLKKGRKSSPNFLQRLWLLERNKEIESLIDLDGRNVLDIKHILLKLEKKHFVIMTLHKAFWKEMLQESISINKIESLNKQITSLTRECDIIFNGLIANYGNNKTVLRTFAKYLEEIKFEKEKAFDMYDEASSIEEEESKKVTTLYLQSNQQKIILILMELKIHNIKKKNINLEHH